jgi:hypothetical protein
MKFKNADPVFGGGIGRLVFDVADAIASGDPALGGGSSDVGGVPTTFVISSPPSVARTPRMARRAWGTTLVTDHA